MLDAILVTAIDQDDHNHEAQKRKTPEEDVPPLVLWNCLGVRRKLMVGADRGTFVNVLGQSVSPIQFLAQPIVRLDGQIRKVQNLEQTSQERRRERNWRGFEAATRLYWMGTDRRSFQWEGENREQPSGQLPLGRIRYQLHPNALCHAGPDRLACKREQKAGV